MGGVSVETLSSRALNRATLERQMLLRRSDLPTLDAVEHLVGMQAQVPANPYVGLWSRLKRFQTDKLAQLLLDRRVVRIVVMRATLHLVSADDCLRLRPLMQPVLDGELARHPQYGPALRRVDIDAVLDVARPLLAERPRTMAEARRHRRALPGPPRRRARLRLPQPAGRRAGPAPRPVGALRPGHLDHRRVVAQPAARRHAECRPCGTPLQTRRRLALS